MTVNAFVYVIESPSPSDLLDGRTEGRSLCEALQLSNIDHSYHIAADRSTFERALAERLITACQQRPTLRPILHLSMHGGQDGIQLTDLDILSWNDLGKLLEPLMQVMQGGLLVCMSTCYGGAGCRMAMFQGPNRPFWALVGNLAEADWSDAAVAYITFYHQFFKGKPVDECVRLMKAASGDDNFVSFYGDKVKADWESFMANRGGGLAALGMLTGTTSLR